MQEGKNTLIAIIVVSSIIASACFGYIARTRAEMGSLATAKPVGVGLLASTDKFGETTESEYFYEVAELLRQKYVEPVKVDQKMASGAVRGMVNSLLDPESNFYDGDQFKAFTQSQAGAYSGIGVELNLQYDQKELKKLQSGDQTTDSLLLLPKVVIASIMPGSPAETAGIQPGDELRAAQGKFIVTGEDVRKLRELQTAVTEGKSSAEELKNVRDDLQTRVENVLSLSRARDYLLTGTEGEISLELLRNGKLIKLDVGRQKTEVKPIEKTLEGTIAIRFFTTLVKELQSVTIEDGMTLDLRNSGIGNFDEMERSLAKFLPAGSYGGVTNSNGQVNRRITLITGPEKPPKVKLLVDNSTTGAAATFARILNIYGNVEVEGALPNETAWTEIQSLPDGSGYTLAIGKYTHNLPAIAQNNPAKSEESK